MLGASDEPSSLAQAALKVQTPTIRTANHHRPQPTNTSTSTSEPSHGARHTTRAKRPRGGAPTACSEALAKADGSVRRCRVVIAASPVDVSLEAIEDEVEGEPELVVGRAAGTVEFNVFGDAWKLALGKHHLQAVACQFCP